MLKCISVFALSLLFAVAGLTQEGSPQAATPPEISFELKQDWRTLFTGIEAAELLVKTPRRMHVWVVRIALDTPGLEFVSTADNGDRPEEVDGLFTSTFLKQEKCQIAINAASFGPVTNEEGTGKDVNGLQISRGKLVSPWKNGYHVLAIGKDNEASILNRDPKDYSTIHTAVSGFQTVLSRGVVKKGDQSAHPRTLVGLSEDQKTMYWMVIDGRQPGYSEGAKTTEVANLLKQLGADSALNLDGGGTTTLVIENSDGTPKVVNKPIHGGTPGRERPSASHLGVRTGKR